MFETLTVDSSFGLKHFLEQTDGVSLLVLVVLGLMSVTCWYLILLKIWQNACSHRASQRFLRDLQSINSYSEAETQLNQKHSEEPFARVLAQGIAACRLLKAPSEPCGFQLVGTDDFVCAALHVAIAEEQQRRERGLSLLASIGSTAPFVGLFGTVWGIYHALLAIGTSGQASLDRVAGPIGEALIMTACGLAVAIPAVLAYNVFLRVNRLHCGALESYAYQIYGLLGVGHLKVPATSITAVSQHRRA